MDTKVCRNMIYILYTFCTHHCVKSGVISGPYFPVFSPNTEKYGPKITPYLDTFYAVHWLYTSCTIFVYKMYTQFNVEKKMLILAE